MHYQIIHLVRGSLLFGMRSPTMHQRQRLRHRSVGVCDQVNETNDSFKLHV